MSKSGSTVSLKDAAKEEDVHLIVLVHGLWGNPNHMNTIEKALRKSLSTVSPQRIVTIKPSSFRFWKTYDGIQRCAELVIADLFFEIEALKQTNNYRVSQISIVGYSLGGLISRYVIGCLEDMKFFDEVTPVFFSTFATPHIGVRFFKKKMFDITANAFAPYLLGTSGLQLFLVDSNKLLVTMADPSSKYYKGLQRFQLRILLANIKNDRSVAFYTSYITNYSPFDRLDYVDVRYFDSLPSATIGKVNVWPKFVDLKRCTKLTSVKDHPGNVQEETSFIRRNKVLRYVILAMAATILVPFYIPLVLCLSLCVSFYSKMKIKFLKNINLNKHWDEVRDSVYRGGTIDSKHAKQGEDRRAERLKLSRQESIKGDTSNLTENAFGNVMFAEQRFVEDQTHLYEDDRLKDDEETDQADDDSDVGFTDTESATKPLILGALLRPKPSLSIPFSENDTVMEKYIEDLKDSETSRIPLFSVESKLPDNSEREVMVTNLNSLNWIKIPVYFDLFNAHDSIVARTGGFRNPKATSTIFLWTSILRKHLAKPGTSGGNEQEHDLTI